MKKNILLATAIVVAGLMITTAASLPIEISSDNQTYVEGNKVNVEQVDVSAQHLSLQSVKTSPNRLPLGLGRADPAFAFAGHQLHPGFGRTGAGLMSAAFLDVNEDLIYYTYSDDDGATFNEEMAYWDMFPTGDYPSQKLWDGTRFFGTYVTNYLDGGGGDVHTFECTDVTDYDTYVMGTTAFSGLLFYDMIDADIACDSSQNEHEWGVSSYVISTNHEAGPMVDGPTVCFANPDDPTSNYISWYAIDGCEHCDVDIDQPIIMSYSVYDYYDPGDDKWTLLCRKMDFDDVLGGFDSLFEITGVNNLTYPAVAANDDNLVILAETDENGNKDIICYYTDDGNPTNVQASFVVDTGDDERYPDVRHISDDDFVCTYVKNDNLYALRTENGGQTWIEVRMQVNDNTDCVVEEYKTSDLCELGAKAMWEEDCDADIDIYIGEVYALPNDPPLAPSITGPNGGKVGTSYEFKFNAVDPNGDNVRYIIDWDDTTSNTTAYGPHNTDFPVSHTWTLEDTYTIKAKAQDIFGAIGPEATKTVNMPRNKAIQTQLFLRFLQNHPNLFPILRQLLGL
jgi:hypothetical protein